MKVNELYLEGIGYLLLEKSRKARSLIMSLQSNGDIRVTLPYWVSYKKAKKTIISNLSWVKKYLQKMDKRKVKNSLLPRNDDMIGRAEVVGKLKERARVIAEKNGFSFGRISVRDQRTQWGSCSPKNNISLNSKLRYLPYPIIDYVILHEFVHIRIKNHQQEFWDEMARYLDFPRKLDRDLKKYDLSFLY